MIHFKNGLSMDGSPLELLVEGGRIVETGGHLTAEAGASVVDCEGMVLLPGLVDLHVHLRDPGYEYKEDIASGTRAAARGGVTSLCCMANTNPVNDTASVTRYILDKAHAEGVVRVYPYGAVTRGLAGKEIAEYADLQHAGVVALSDDGKPIESAGMLRTALRYAKAFGLVIASHCEDKSLVGEGVMHEGVRSSLMGMRGIPRSSEDTMVARDCALALETGGHIHICHVSAKTSVDIIRHFKALGAPVTCETSPQYIAGTDVLCEGYDSAARVNPPMREEADVEAIIEGLLDGTIDAIATDHAPHHRDEKEVEFSLAHSGISGLETSLALCHTALVKTGRMTLAQLVEKMSGKPAELFHLPGGCLERGQVADIALFDPQEAYTIDRRTFASRGKNTPFHGREVTGRVKATFVGGECVFKEERP